MLVVKLSSGIGNQLFMYSFFMYLQQNTEQEILFECSSFNWDISNRRSELEILYPNYPTLERTIHVYLGRNKYLRKIHSKIIRLFSGLEVVEDSSCYVPDKSYDNNLVYYFNGYWQTNFYVDKLRNRDELFAPKTERPHFVDEYHKKIESCNYSVSMHVRRGDYFNNPLYVKRYGVCSVEYYHNAIDFFSDKFDSYNLFVFSDDLEWVKNNLDFHDKIKITYVENYEINSYWYIYLMSLCNHNIISNSSFSWWAAYLNSFSSKYVLTPSEWRFDTAEHLALDNWIKIPCL